MNLKRSSRPLRPSRFAFKGSKSTRHVPRYGRIALFMVLLLLLAVGIKSCAGWKKIEPTVRYERIIPPPNAATAPAR